MSSDISQEPAYLYWVSGLYWSFADHEVSTDEDPVEGYELKAAGTFEAVCAAHRLLAGR